MRVEDSHREPESQFSLAMFLVPKWAYGGLSMPVEKARGRKVFKLDINAPLYDGEEREERKVLAFGSLAS